MRSRSFLLMPVLASLIAGILLTACAPTRTVKSAGEQIDDSVVTARVKSALAEGLGTGDAIRADIETYRGRVQLNGFVDSAEKKSDATRIAKGVLGVRAVDNNLHVATEQRSLGEFVDDKVILAKVKTALARDPVVAGHEVNVDVRQGVVQLAGFVDTAEARSRAGELVGTVGGVSRVENDIEVKQSARELKQSRR